MTDHKFTDEEVIKALKCCNDNLQYGCDDCVFNGAVYDDESACVDKLNKATRDLINRQKEELEDLREIVYMDRTEAIKKLKAEAIKEFAERLKDRVYNKYFVILIDYLVKEMTEEKA